MANTLSVESLCSGGNCSTSHTIKDGFQFDDKVYTKDDAEMIERAGFARTQIFSSTALAGSRDLGGEDNAGGGPLVTVVPGIKAGQRRELFAEHYVADWQGELDGRLADRCTYYPKAIRRVVEVERTICTKKVFVESDLCASELIESYKDDMLLAGALNEKNTSFLNEVVLDAFIEANHINIDRHAWRGDYGSSDNKVKHVDGFFKIAFNAFSTSQGQQMSYTFVGDLTGQSILGLVGGLDFAIDFNTDTDTTVSDLVTFLSNEYEPMTGRKVFQSVTLVGNREVVVQAWDGELVALNMVIGEKAAGIEICPSDATIKACNPADAGVASITTVEQQEAVTSLSPIGVDLVPVNSSNVIQVLDDWFNTVNDVDPEILEIAFGGKLMVARNIYNAYRYATHNHDRSINGGCGDMRCIDYMGLQLIPINYMPKDAFLFAAPEDLVVAVDLVSDATNFEQWKEQGCDTLNFKGAMSIGFQIRRVNKVSGTFCDKSGRRLNFRDLMPCSIKRENKYYPVVR